MTVTPHSDGTVSAVWNWRVGRRGRRVGCKRLRRSVRAGSRSIGRPSLAGVHRRAVGRSRTRRPPAGSATASDHVLVETLAGNVALGRGRSARSRGWWGPRSAGVKYRGRRPRRRCRLRPVRRRRAGDTRWRRERVRARRARRPGVLVPLLPSAGRGRNDAWASTRSAGTARANSLPARRPGGHGRSRHGDGRPAGPARPGNFAVARPLIDPLPWPPDDGPRKRRARPDRHPRRRSSTPYTRSTTPRAESLAR